MVLLDVAEALGALDGRSGARGSLQLGEVEWRELLTTERLVEDLLACLNSTEWPAGSSATSPVSPA